METGLGTRQNSWPRLGKDSDQDHDQDSDQDQDLEKDKDQDQQTINDRELENQGTRPPGNWGNKNENWAVLS